MKMSGNIILKNGRIIDPYSGVDGKGSLVISDGKISAVKLMSGRTAGRETGRPEHDKHDKSPAGSGGEPLSSPINDIDVQGEGAEVIDAEGYIITPGLVDIHTHLYPLAELGIYPEASLFPGGVTTAVDAGTSGCGTFGLHRAAPLFGRVNVKFLINVSTAGLSAFGSYNEDISPARFDRKRMTELVREYPDEIVGLKLRFGRDIWSRADTVPLEAAANLARDLETRLMVHCTNPPVEMENLVAHLDRGDILTHAFNGKGSTIVGKDGKIKDEVLAARERGVVFDVGDAGWHISFKTLQAAFEQGFYPDTISTDLTVNGLYKKNKSFSMPYVMSRFLNLGMPLYDVIRSVTGSAAKAAGLEDTAGSISQGSCADISILKVQKCENVFTDGEGEQFTGTDLIRVMMTVRKGQIVYRDIEL